MFYSPVLLELPELPPVGNPGLMLGKLVLLQGAVCSCRQGFGVASSGKPWTNAQNFYRLTCKHAL